MRTHTKLLIIIFIIGLLIFTFLSYYSWYRSKMDFADRIDYNINHSQIQNYNRSKNRRSTQAYCKRQDNVF